MNIKEFLDERRKHNSCLTCHYYPRCESFSLSIGHNMCVVLEKVNEKLDIDDTINYLFSKRNEAEEMKEETEKKCKIEIENNIENIRKDIFSQLKSKKGE